MGFIAEKNTPDKTSPYIFLLLVLAKAEKKVRISGLTLVLTIVSQCWSHRRRFV
jgi:hypothetical protein